MTTTSDHKILLEPYAEIPLREKWLFENKLALKKVEQGLRDAESGKLLSLGSFSKYLKDEKDK